MLRNFYTIFIFSLLILNSTVLFSQGNYKTDNGTLGGYYSSQINWEESKILHPSAPGLINKIYMNLGGNTAIKDTLWIVCDPSDGYLPPSLYCYYIAAYQGYIYDYNGTPGWHNIDISDIKLSSGGVNGFVVQHVIKPNGPYFGLDKDAQDQKHPSSFLNNVYVPNKDFYDIKGTIYSLTQNDYMVRCDIDYKYKNQDGTPAITPPPTMLDKTIAAKLVDGDGKPIVSEMASVVDWNKDGYQDIAIKSNFYQNNGDGTFTNVSAKINAPNNGTVWADVDNDGNLDFITANGWMNDKIYYGNGDGTFTEETDPVIVQNAPTVTPMWIDYDTDGLVDLYIAYGRKEENGVETYYQDKLFRNLGNRKFKDVTVESGIAAGESTPLDCWGGSITDYNGDGWPDIFVATYRLAPDLLYRNNKNGTFTEVGAATGARGVKTNSPAYFGHGMGSDWGDFDNDGDLDLCVGNLGHPDERALSSNKSLILRNQGLPNNNFVDFTDSARLQFFEMNSGVVWADLDLDGYLDLVHAQYSYEAKGVSNDKNTRFYLNQGAEQNFRFEDKTWELGSYIHGAWSPVRGDFDNDGDMDIVVASSNENVKLFENQISKKGNWISFVLEGSPGKKVNYSAYGSSITVTAGGKTYFRALPGSVINARASQSSNELSFGIGNSFVEKAEIKFSNEKVVVLTGLQTNRKYRVNENGEANPFPISAPQLLSPVNYSQANTVKGNLKWFKSGGAISYEIIIALDLNFVNVVNTLNSDVNAVDYDLTANKTYYWKVRAKDETTGFKWSDIWSFATTDGSPKPQSTNLIAPANNSVGVARNTEFKWQLVEGMKALNIQIATDANFSANLQNILKQNDNILTNYSVAEPLNANTKYYWRVRVAELMDVPGNANWSEWTPTWEFTTWTAVSVEESSIVKSGLNFIGISPNPSSENINLKFSIINPSNIDISIFDNEGKLVRVLENKMFNTGIYDLNYNLSDMTSGLYHFRICDGRIILGRKINIVK